MPHRNQSTHISSQIMIMCCSGNAVQIYDSKACWRVFTKHFKSSGGRASADDVVVLRIHIDLTKPKLRIQHYLLQLIPYEYLPYLYKVNTINLP